MDNRYLCQKCKKPERPLMSNGINREYKIPSGFSFICSMCVMRGLSKDQHDEKKVERPKRKQYKTRSL